MTGGVPQPEHDGNEVATILLVTSMVEHRNRMIATLLERFEKGSELMHHERHTRCLERQARELVEFADRITILAQDNAYDVRNLMVHLDQPREPGCFTDGDAGHHGQVCYIQ